MSSPKDLNLEAGTTELYVDTAYYDFEYESRTADVRWYVERYLAAEGPVLELGVGTGRIATRAVRRGATVVGLDMATTMLRRAMVRRQALPKKRRSSLQLVCGDMRRFAFNRRFALVSCPFNAFQHLYGREDVEACLESVRNALAPDGRFVLDVLMPDFEYLNRPAFKKYPGVKFKHPTFGQRYAYAEQSLYESTRQICQMRFYYDRVDAPADVSEGDSGPESFHIDLSHRYFFPAELEALLHYNGFEMLHRFGDFQGDRLDSGAESQLLICRLRS